MAERKELAERNERIVAAVKAGRHKSEVGLEHDICEERVRQICFAARKAEQEAASGKG